MKHKLQIATLFLFSQFIFLGCATKPIVKVINEEKEFSLRIEKEEIKEIISTEARLDSLSKNFAKMNFSFPIHPRTKVDTIIIDATLKEITFRLSKEFATKPFRNDNVKIIYDEIKNYLGNDFADYKLNIISLNQNIEDLIPNYFRLDKSLFDEARLKTQDEITLQVVRNNSKPNIITNGLNNRNIALWHSHGWYFNNEEKRWEWQRPRLFQAVEDLIPMSFTIPYIIPMLENAGANVFVPRERDIQTNEIIIDNDSKKNRSYVEKSLVKKFKWKKSEISGFAISDMPYAEGFNPFQSGTTRFTESDQKASALVEYIPEIPEAGEYGVYISFSSTEENVSDADFTVYHEGGKTNFKVNQKIGGGTWIWLGKFYFKKGFNPKAGKVVATNLSNEKGKIVSVDAVRFGGGMGIVERNDAVSGRAKFLEASRYWMQFAGMPDTLVYNLNNNKNDYNDDFQGRPEFVNYLTGAPSGPNRNRNEKGLQIPIDISLSFHTDAGITDNDTTIGTLLIYSINGAQQENVFPSGLSRYANRDLADILQAQIVNDIRAKYDNAWNQRQLMEARYSEAVRPNVPAVLLELLSHQNFLDMKFFHDPRFRFDVSRSIYKAFLRFLSVQNNFEYVVQPLPVNYFSSEMDERGNVKLRWKEQKDILEPTADAKQFIVYTRIDGGGFDNGVIVNKNEFEIKNLEKGKIFSFKVTAVNEGGESFPSEILSLHRSKKNSQQVIIVNGFDRLAGPATVDEENYKGFINYYDAGVQDKIDFHFTGEQYDFDPNSKFITNDSPGHGSSFSNYETKIIAGNSFDYPYLHGLSIKNLDYTFVSSSDEAVENGYVNLSNYVLVNLILGEEKKTKWQKSFADSLHGIQFEIFSTSMIDKIKNYLNSGGNLFLSGAYVGRDLFENQKDSSIIKFAESVLKFSWVTGFASREGEVFSVNKNFIPNFTFNTKLDSKIYQVEAPDAIKPINGSELLFRYYENSFSAGIGYNKEYGLIVLGFPFETILDQTSRNLLMKNSFDYLGVDKKRKK